jgi:hypothetical protein
MSETSITPNQDRLDLACFAAVINPSVAMPRQEPQVIPRVSIHCEDRSAASKLRNRRKRSECVSLTINVGACLILVAVATAAIRFAHQRSYQKHHAFPAVDAEFTVSVPRLDIEETDPELVLADQPREPNSFASKEMYPPTGILPEVGPSVSDSEAESRGPTVLVKRSATVTPEQISTLARTLRTAHSAVLDGNYELALSELDKVVTLPMLPEHFAKYERLILWAGYAQGFQVALQQSIDGLRPGDDFEIGSGMFVVFVEATEDSITLRVSGTNRTYSRDNLPAGLAVALADRWLTEDDPASLAVKGAYLASLRETDDQRRANAREWLEEASRGGVPGQLHQVLDDTYDLDVQYLPPRITSLATGALAQDATQSGL